jgi:hypothetical protein
VRCKKTVFGLLLIIGAGLAAQEDPFLSDAFPWLQERAVVLDIAARVVEQGKVEIWNESHQRVTLPGRPVDLKLVGSNVVVAVQFIPYLRRHGQNMLVAQGQIWLDVPNQGIRCQTTMQAIPVEFEEPIYFFPLGPAEQADDARIEIVLTMRPYKARSPAEGEGAARPVNNTPGNNSPP